MRGWTPAPEGFHRIRSMARAAAAAPSALRGKSRSGGGAEGHRDAQACTTPTSGSSPSSSGLPDLDRRGQISNKPEICGEERTVRAGRAADHREVRSTCRSRSRTFLRKVLRFTPSSSAARIWLPRVAASAAPISGPSISRRTR